MSEVQVLFPPPFVFSVIMQDLLIHEKRLWKKGNTYISGVDEVGRGCLAGPVVAAAVILPASRKIAKKLARVNDSKLLSPQLRRELFSVIREHALDYSIGIVSANVIDQINILQATFLAMRRALAGLASEINYVLVDGNKKIPRISYEQSAIIQGDSSSLSIAAASILAKVVRDEIMVRLAENYAGYFFEKHKGYGTKVHRQALEEKGLTDLHRRTFCKSFLPNETEIPEPFSPGQLSMF
jgi:ribonuclease HII